MSAFCNNTNNNNKNNHKRRKKASKDFFLDLLMEVETNVMLTGVAALGFFVDFSDS